ncbi:MAG: tetratricopeptide repeat protein, partial [Arenimonas sp.]
AIYDRAREMQSAEQTRHKNDPALKDYFEYFRQANYSAAFKSVEIAALEGNSQAQVEIASLYLKGQGVPVNINNAIFWLDKSHEQGNVMASPALGEIYFSASLGHQDFEKANTHYRLCAMRLMVSCVVPYAMLHVTNGSGHYDPVNASAWLEIGVDLNAPGAVKNRDTLLPQLSEEQVEEIQAAKLELLSSIAKELKHETGAK